MNQLFGLMLVLLLSVTSSATAQEWEAKMNISELSVRQAEECIIVITDYSDDVLYFFDSTGQQVSLPVYKPQKRQDGRYDHRFCGKALYIPSKKTIFYGGRELTQCAYGVRK